MSAPQPQPQPTRKPNVPAAEQWPVVRFFCKRGHLVIGAAAPPQPGPARLSYTAQVEQQLDRMQKAGVLNPWCSLCGSPRREWTSIANAQSSADLMQSIESETRKRIMMHTFGFSYDVQQWIARRSLPPAPHQVAARLHTVRTLQVKVPKWIDTRSFEYLVGQYSETTRYGLEAGFAIRAADFALVLAKLWSVLDRVEKANEQKVIDYFSQTAELISNSKADRVLFYR